MSAGFTALFPVSKASLRDEDIRALGGQTGRAPYAHIWAEVVPSGVPTGRSDDQNGSTLFAGWVDLSPPEGHRNSPSAPLAQITDAFDTIGDAACRTVRGEWFWIRWNARDRCVTLAASENLLQPLYYASNGTSVAVSTSLRRIAGLPSLSGTFDRGGLLGAMGRASLRGTLGDRTLLKGVHSLQPGSVVTLGPGDARSVRSAPPRPSLSPWTGSFEDAVTQTRSLLEEIVDVHLRRHKRSAVMLSGGLDSSTLAWLLAEGSGDPGAHVAISSAAPEGSGIADETHHAEAVARALGLPFQRVVPAAEANPYRPTAAAFAFAETPTMSQRHYLYDALHTAAADAGASSLLDGALGELSVTSKIRLPWYQQPVQQARRAVLSAIRRPTPEGAQDLFHVRLAPHQLADYESMKLPAPGTRQNAWFKAELQGTNTTIPGLWCALPFRDKRLLELVATMPDAFHVSRAQNRRLGRAILEGRIPDAVRSRRAGMPFSPDYEARLRSHSAAAMDRIEDFRAAGADEWIDLEWLRGALGRIGKREANSPRERLQAQLTAMTGEFLVWWREA